jgi:hypothetical protein
VIVQHPTQCPTCGRVNPLATDMREDSAPNEGDVSVCWGCGTPAIFDRRSEGGLRAPTKQEQAEIACDGDIQLMLQSWRSAR